MIQTHFTRVPNFLIYSDKLKPSEFRILIILMSYPEKKIFPPIAYLSKIGKMRKNTVHSVLKSLKEKNIISWIRGNSQGRNNSYFIHPYNKWRHEIDSIPNDNYDKLIEEYNCDNIDFDEKFGSRSLSQNE